LSFSHLVAPFLFNSRGVDFDTVSDLIQKVMNIFFTCVCLKISYFVDQYVNKIDGNGKRIFSATIFYTVDIKKIW